MISGRPLPELASTSASEEGKCRDEQGSDATLLSILQPVLTVFGTYEATQFSNLCKQVRSPLYLGRMIQPNLFPAEPPELQAAQSSTVPDTSTFLIR